MNSKKIYIYINTKYDFLMQLFFGNVLNLYLLKNNICKNNQVLYITSLSNIDKSNSIILPIYGLYNSDYDFDDKISFYDYLKNNENLLKDIELIPTFETLKCKNKFSKYIVKHKDGKGSKNIFVVEDYLHNIIQKYDIKIYQIQKLIKFKYIFGVNCACKKGQILSFYCYKTKSLSKNDYGGIIPFKIYNYIQYNIIENFIYKIISMINYTGFIEFEFLITDKKIYIMECNPRISGVVITQIYCDEIIFKYINNNNSQNVKLHFSKNVLIDFNINNILAKTYPNLIKIILQNFLN